jgi:peptidoglycan hydrolase CwlO-like protein
VGFLIAWIIKTIAVYKLKKQLKQTEGLLESERLIKETLRKENALAFQLKENIENELGEKLVRYQQIVKQMDGDILLLQKSNEETENAFREKQPELFELKMQLIEAQNNINRLKALLQNNTSE